jgi:hypothetical protein
MSMVHGTRSEPEPVKITGKWLFADLAPGPTVVPEGFVITRLACKGRAPTGKMSSGVPATGTASGNHGFHAYGSLKAHNSRGMR